MPASVRRALSLVGVAAVLRDAAAQSAKSCGGPNDHFKDVVVKMVPDPPVPGQPFTVEVSGTNDEVVTSGHVKTDLAIGALGIIHSQAKLDIPFTINPTPFVKGPVKVNVGPVSLPKVPGTTTVNGKVTTIDDAGQQVLCVLLDLKVGGPSEMPMEMLNDSAPILSNANGITSCSKPSDHLKNFNLVVDHGAMTVTGNVDEALSTMKINLDMKLSKFFVHIPLAMSVPVTVSPPLPQGAFRLTVGPAGGALSPDPKVSLTGKAVVADQNNEEVLCLNVDQVVAQEPNAANSEIVV